MTPATGRTAKRRPYAARVPLAQRREQLLDAALTVIDRDGYDRLSIDAIAREAGVTRPVVYGAYDGLGPLLAALLDRQQQRALTQLYAALPTGLGDGDLATVIDDAAPALCRMLLDDPPTWRAIIAAPADVPETVRARVEGDREGVRQVIAGLVEASRPGADAELLSHALLAVLEQYGRLVLAEPDRFTAERMAAAMRALLT
ncbi:TetR/AcrR family transcriptional regulator [Nocardioides caeni]|uniref:TetR/AcrR family transcriptional regulator n=1 Tax=Nocardioides caeni TaxID=574700 RepID=A0A4S8N3F3_9ACTN|nr:TetR/AcrR family transcriptional regulator [Nocardioides caeni]THV10061.1 TetR/AcrR family transcriptional regulator [Nocardioides caeni]